jgi:hypothetical protein
MDYNIRNSNYSVASDAYSTGAHEEDDQRKYGCGSGCRSCGGC